jgi:hypothetical protein
MSTMTSILPDESRGVLRRCRARILIRDNAAGRFVASDVLDPVPVEVEVQIAQSWAGD